MVNLPENFVISKFYQYGGAPRYIRSSNIYQSSCPICREGNSWLKKQRCYFIAKKNIIHCHNCGWHGTPVKWIMELSGDSYSKILEESKEYDTVDIDDLNSDNQKIKKQTTYDLPSDCIDLEDEFQISYFKSNKIIQKATELLKSRRLLTAINRPNKFYISLNDYIHANRLIIPFYDENNKIVFYQSRKLLESDNKAKYLSKRNSERTLFNVDKIDENIPYVFVTEGPIDSTFIKNGVALAGISEKGSDTFTSKQKEQIRLFPFHQIIFVLDNQWSDNASKSKTSFLIESGKNVFIWPKEYKKFKDINDVCVSFNMDEFPYKFILKNTYSGFTAKLKLAEIK